MQGPALVIHADTDTTVPYSHGVFIQDALARKGQLWKFVTLKVEDSAKAHGQMFHTSPTKEQIVEVVGEFLRYLCKKSE